MYAIMFGILYSIRVLLDTAFFILSSKLSFINDNMKEIFKKSN
jgi:hypothetical protein